MDDGNSFLSNYNKDRDSGSSDSTPKSESKSSGHKEEKSGLAKPGASKGGSHPPSLNTPKSAGSTKSAGESPGYKYEEKSGFKKPSISKGGSLPPFRKIPKITGPIIAGAAVLVVAIILMVVLLGGGIKVIDLTGWTITDARLWADENGVMLQEEQEYNDQYDENAVISQDVAVGTKAKKGDFIKVTVSLGHDLSVTLPLPDLMNMTVEEVEAWAKENYMAKVRVTSEYNDTVPLGNVIRYEINDSTVVDEVKRDTPIYVIVSKGLEDESSIQVEVPDFRTMTLGDSYAFANENGVVLTVEEQYDDYVPKGSIISQSEKVESNVTKGSEIRLIVSKGKKITIPDFSQYSKTMAATVAEKLGITCIQTEWYSKAKAGAFLSQSIKADTIYQDGDVLELKYSLNNKISVSPFETLAEIELWADELNQKGANITINAKTVMSYSAKGAITYQDKVNVLIGPNETISVTVSAGGLIHAPDFIGLGKSYSDAVTREIAIEMCEALNIIPDFVEEYNDSYLPGEVWYQSVPAGIEIDEGAVITLKYNPNDKWTDVPDFIGDDKDDVEDNDDVNRKLKIVFDGSGNKVAAQSIVENTRVSYGTKVVLTLE